jgi:hypothetical protein
MVFNRDIQLQYIEWLSSLVLPDRETFKQYKKLMTALYSTEFKWIMDLDEDRYSDGYDLRYRFTSENNLSAYEVDELLCGHSYCSVLEMMVALTIRMEDDIVGGDPRFGNRACLWFQTMLTSLHIIHMVNNSFDLIEFKHRMDIFLNREYAYNGDGGLFTINNPREDMRKVYIWYQMNWYLNTVN